MRIHKGTAEIRTVNDWFLHSPPRGGEKHWVEGRSAYELAQAWCRSGQPEAPKELADVLGQKFSGLKFTKGEPECRVAFDSFRGEPRNTDFAIWAEDKEGPLSVSVEAKADEKFGDLVVEVLARAARRIASEESVATNATARTQQLALALFGPHEGGLPILGALRYQLLTAAAGALAHAEKHGATRAVLVIHEFVTTKTQKVLRDENSRDLDDFARRISGGSVESMPKNTITDFFTVPGKPLFKSPCRLCIAKIQTALPGASEHN